MNERALVIIPTYNERENLAAIVADVLAFDSLHILVVDDNSPDGTGELADELAARYSGRLHVLHRPGKQGLGRAYIAGFRYALERDYDLIFEMDADFSHDPRHLPQFLAAIQHADLVLGSRYVPGGGTVNWSPVRKIISRGGSLYARTILGLPINDLTGGFKCFRRQVLETIDLDSVAATGYAFQIEMTYRTHQLGFRIVETPIVFVDRRVGQSKMSRRILFEAMGMVWRMRLSPPPEVRPAAARPEAGRSL
ncbi:MAG: polyprenol monophosphomannose synthase [Chloroflexi bacterium]|nr:polyprenol monophosphomannose synthase [Chloroflexota bacterium]